MPFGGRGTGLRRGAHHTHEGRSHGQAQAARDPLGLVEAPLALARRVQGHRHGGGDRLGPGLENPAQAPAEAVGQRGPALVLAGEDQVGQGALVRAECARGGDGAQVHRAGAARLAIGASGQGVSAAAADRR